MSTKVGVGISRDTNSFEAGRDAAFEAKVSLHSDEINLAIVFACVNFNLTDVIRGVKRVIKSAPLVGSSGAGVITNTGSQKRAVAVMLLNSSNIKFGTGIIGPVANGKERVSGQKLAKQTTQQIKGFNRHAFSLFCDNLISNPADLIAGIQEVLGVSFPISGGFSADDGRFGKTYQFFDEQILSYSAAGILWSGNCECTVTTGHGWKPLGRPLTITGSGINRIKTIEGKPALKLYEDYFGENAADLKQSRLSKIALLYPLGFYMSKEDGYILRNVCAVDDDGSLILQGNVPASSEVHLMIGTKGSLIEATKQAANQAKTYLEKKNKKIAMAIISDSFSRYKLLGRNSNKEIEQITAVFGAKLPIIGFYSFGEQAPLSALNYIGRSYILNESISILAIGE